MTIPTKSALTTLLETSERLREKATPGPWSLTKAVDSWLIQSFNHWVARVLQKSFYDTEITRHQENAGLIVHAVNSLQARDEIIKVLVEAVKFADKQQLGSTGNVARAALAQAERIAEEAIE